MKHLFVVTIIVFSLFFASSGYSESCSEGLIKAMEKEGLSTSQIMHICENAKNFDLAKSSNLPDKFGAYIKKDGHLYPLMKYTEAMTFRGAVEKAMAIKPIAVSNKDEIIFYHDSIGAPMIEIVEINTGRRLKPTIQSAENPDMYLINLKALSQGKYFIFADNAIGFTALCWGTFALN